jgi:hypothetical protein
VVIVAGFSPLFAETRYTLLWHRSHDGFTTADASGFSSESAPARVADPNEWNFANHNSPHYRLLATERHAELKGVYGFF